MTLPFLAVIGRNTRFLLNPEQSTWLQNHAVTIMIGTFLALSGAALLIPRERLPLAAAFFRTLCFGMLFAIVAFSAPFALAHGIPGFPRAPSGTTETMWVRVYAIGPTHTKLGCMNVAWLLWAGEPNQGRKLCSVPGTLHSDLSPGDVLFLKGKITDYGFRYRSMHRAPAE